MGLSVAARTTRKWSPHHTGGKTIISTHFNASSLWNEHSKIFTCYMHSSDSIIKSFKVSTAPLISVLYTLKALAQSDRFTGSCVFVLPSRNGRDPPVCRRGFSGMQLASSCAPPPQQVSKLFLVRRGHRSSARETNSGEPNFTPYLCPHSRPTKTRQWSRTMVSL